LTRLLLRMARAPASEQHGGDSARRHRRPCSTCRTAQCLQQARNKSQPFSIVLKNDQQPLNSRGAPTAAPRHWARQIGWHGYAVSSEPRQALLVHTERPAQRPCRFQMLPKKKKRSWNPSSQTSVLLGTPYRPVPSPGTRSFSDACIICVCGQALIKSYRFSLTAPTGIAVVGGGRRPPASTRLPRCLPACRNHRGIAFCPPASRPLLMR